MMPQHQRRAAASRWQPIVLAILIMVAMVLGIVRMTHLGRPASVMGAVTKTPSSNIRPPDAQWHTTPMAATWPVELHHNVFAWEQLLNLSAPTGPANIDAAAITQAARQTIRLEAIIVINDTSYARINGQLLRQGQTINNYMIQRIDSRHIVVVQHGIEAKIDL